MFIKKIKNILFRSFPKSMPQKKEIFRKIKLKIETVRALLLSFLLKNLKNCIISN
jgi:hypothetical protein